MKRLAAALMAAVLGGLLAAVPASAADGIVVRTLDVSNFPQVKISAVVSGPAVTPDAFALRENGRIVPQIKVVPISETSTSVGIVLVIDVSGSMRESGKLDAAKGAAKEFVAQKPDKDQIAVVSFNDKPVVVSGFSPDPAVANRAIDGLQATGETALFDAVQTAATLFGDRGDLVPNIVVLSDGADTVSHSTVDQAQSTLVGSHATLFSVGLHAGRGTFDAGSLTRLAQASGGRYTETTDPATLKSLYGNVQRQIQNQFEITYTSTATEGSVAVSVAAHGLTATAGPSIVGSVSHGSAAKPQAVNPSRFSKPLSGSGSLPALGFLVFLAAGLLVVSLAALTRGGVPSLSATLRPYGPEGGTAFDTTPRSGDLDLAQTAIVKRAVEATARLAHGRGILEGLDAKLAQADLPIRAAEALFFYAAGLVTVTVVGGLVGKFFGAAIAAIAFGLGPPAVLNFLGARRRARFTSQLPDVLRLMASSLRSGFSLLQAADAAANQMEDPMGKELRRVLVEARLGRPLEVALDDSAKRAQSPDYDWAVMAIGIQREVGGNLAELLSTVAETMVSRERLRQEIKTLTAEGRISAIVLAVLPFVIGAAVYVLNPGYLDPLLHRTSGQIALLVAIVFGIGGFMWMRKIVDIPS